MGNKIKKTICAYTFGIICISSVIGVLIGCDRQTHSGPVVVQERPLASGSPFVLTITAGSSGITLAKRTPHDAELPRRDFYVLLSNVSQQPQTVWQEWNSWGYQAISFELTTADGRNHVVSKRQQGFTMNGPTTDAIEPGEAQVYVVHLDEFWEIQPPIPKTDEMPITKSNLRGITHAGV
jgi:hypothetical protein